MKEKQLKEGCAKKPETDVNTAKTTPSKFLVAKKLVIRKTRRNKEMVRKNAYFV